MIINNQIQEMIDQTTTYNTFEHELLTLAAKAGGIPTTCWNDGTEPYSSGVGFIVENRIWNPLTNDGDALRLAVKLGFINPCCWPNPAGFVLEQIKNGVDGDWYVATRLAIVMAAADIGRNMVGTWYEQPN